MNLPLLKPGTDYMSTLPTPIMFMIFANGSVESNYNLSGVSKKLHTYVTGFIPPVPLTNYYTSDKCITYLERMEDCKRKYDNHKHIITDIDYVTFVPNYGDYDIGLAVLRDMLYSVPYSVHFRYKNGEERIQKLCGIKKRSPNMVSCCSSCFRDPYQLLFLTTLLIICSCALGWFMYVNMVINLTEITALEAVVYRANLEKHIRRYKEYGYADRKYPVGYAFMRNFFASFKTKKCYDHNDSYEFASCFYSYSEYCSNARNNWMRFDTYLTHLVGFFNGTYSKDQLYYMHANIYNYVCRTGSNKWIIGQNDFVAFIYHEVLNRHDTIEITGRNIGKPCLSCDETRCKKSLSKFSISLYAKKVKVDPECIAYAVTEYPDLKHPVWQYIYLIVVLWVLYFSSMIYAICADPK